MLAKNTCYFWRRSLTAEQGDKPSSSGADYLWGQGEAGKTQSDYASHNTSNNLLACLQTLHVWPFLDCAWLATALRNWYPNGFYTQNRNCVLVSNKDIYQFINTHIQTLILVTRTSSCKDCWPAMNSPNRRLVIALIPKCPWKQNAKSLILLLTITAASRILKRRPCVYIT